MILELNKAKEEISNPSQMEISSPEKSPLPPQPLAKLSKSIQEAQVFTTTFATRTYCQLKTRRISGRSETGHRAERAAQLYSKAW